MTEQQLGDLEKALRSRNKSLDNINDNFDMCIAECHRLAETAHNAGKIISKLDSDFQEITKLDSTDIAFLFVAVALQCLRQYVIGTLSQRTDDQTAAKKVKNGAKEHSDRSHRYYKPSLQEVITNPVPFDANIGANGALAGGGKLGHRATAIGHDPLLGLLFGTSNIATSTLTTWDFRSYHIVTGGKRDVFGNNADTIKVLNYTKDKILGSVEEKTIVATSLVKEIQHLRSDLYSKNSLPLPVVSSISPSLASKLAQKGLDMGNLVKVANQAGFAILINTIIAMIHSLFYDETKYENRGLYEVKTRKILSYSNVIASTSNVIGVAVGCAAGGITGQPEVVAKSLNYLDIGGIIVTIYRVITDYNFIQQVKEEFLTNHWNEIVLNGGN